MKCRLQVLGGLGGATYPNWPASTSSNYAATAAASLIAYAKTNKLDGYDLDFEDNLNADWVSKWTSIVGQLRVRVCATGALQATNLCNPH